VVAELAEVTMRVVRRWLRPWWSPSWWWCAGAAPLDLDMLAEKGAWQAFATRSPAH
jgi:hypothetical protein